MKVLKLLLKVAGGLLLVIVLAGVAFYASDPLYVQRLVKMNPGEGVTNLDLYWPKETVAGPLVEDLVTGDPAAQPIAADALAAADKYATDENSIAMIIWQGGAIRYERYWPGFDATTKTDPASMHKSVMALAVGMAISEGKIPSLDARASTWLTEWQGDARREITIRQLLQMSSGLELITFNPNPLNRYLKSMLSTDRSEIMLALPLVAEPGSRFEYANVNSQLLGIVLERATGERYASFLSRTLWSKLGAGDADVWLEREGGTARTDCCLHTTARGWLKVGLLLMNEGRVGSTQVVPAAYVREMLTPAATNPNYGFQVWIGSPPGTERAYNSASQFKARHSAPYVADDVYFLDGFGGQRVYVVPSRQLVIVHTGYQRLAWDDAMLPNLIVNGLPAPAAAVVEQASETTVDAAGS